MTVSQEAPGTEARLSAIELRVALLRKVALAEAMVIVLVVAGLVRMAAAPLPAGSRLRAPLEIINSDGSVIASIAEFTKEKPLPLVSNWLQIGRPESGVCLTLSRGNDRPAVQLLSGQDAGQNSVSGMRVYSQENKLSIAIDSVGTESKITACNSQGGRSAFTVRTTDAGTDLTINSTVGSGLRLLAGKSGNSITLADATGDRRVEMGSGDRGGWIAAFPNTAQQNGPWAEMTTGSITLHPDSSRRAAARIYSRAGGGNIELLDAVGKKTYHAP